MKLTRKLPEAELEVMLAVWDADAPVPRIRLEEMLRARRWNRNTINTYLARLMARGALTSERRGNTNYYLPAVTREEYRQFAAKRLLDQLYGSNVACLVAALDGGGALDDGALEALRRYLDARREHP